MPHHTVRSQTVYHTTTRSKHSIRYFSLCPSYQTRDKLDKANLQPRTTVLQLASAKPLFSWKKYECGRSRFHRKGETTRVKKIIAKPAVAVICTFRIIVKGGIEANSPFDHLINCRSCSLTTISSVTFLKYRNFNLYLWAPLLTNVCI